METQDLIRMAAFAYVDELSEHGSIPLSRVRLSNFTFDGAQVHLVGPQGIFKPAQLDLPISILTVWRAPGEDCPYDDEIDTNDYLLYKYRGTDPQHRDNRSLREVRDRAITLLYLEGVTKGRYLPSAAAIIEDHPESLTFGVQLMPIEPLRLEPSTRLP